MEVIRGIPSAEYGDLTSGLMVVKSKIGVTPWQVKGKINPGMMNYSLGKGLRMDKYGVLNFNLDYAQAWGDPRMKTKSFDRYTMSIGYGLYQSLKCYSAYRNVDEPATVNLPDNLNKLVYNYDQGVEGTTDPSGIDAAASIKNGAKIVYLDTNNSTNDFHLRKDWSLK